MIGYLDCSTGVSGDKFLGALLDAASRLAEKDAAAPFSADDLQRIASELAPEAQVAVDRVVSHGISALSVRVEASREPTSRSWKDIGGLLEASELPSRVRFQTLRAFQALAIAEARVHGVEPEAVHFHEVGAIDSIVDIVGVCAGLEALGVERLIASPVATGSGTIESAHGLLPVPAPATAELLAAAQAPLTPGPAETELTTPTGAALLVACVDGFGALPEMRPLAQGFGAGTREIGAANVCRLLLGEAAGEGTGVREGAYEPVAVLETNIDHLPAEQLAFAAEELLAEGALDVWQSPIVMKKGRAAVALGVLVRPTEADAFARRIVELTGSLGVRVRHMERYVAEREARTVATPWGAVSVKIGGGRVRPEHDEVAEIARRTGRAYNDVAHEIELLHAFENEE